MVTISIVIPAKDEADNLPLLLDGIDSALAAQGGYEVLVVDDGSTDATAEVIRARMRTHPNLRLIRHDVSGGQSAAVHSGVLAAQGGIVCTLDADGQVVSPGFIDIHPHFDSVQQLYEYQNAGFTTVIGGGSGPKTVGIECPGAFNLHRMLEAIRG